MAEDRTYIVARVRAVEGKMPGGAWFQRMAGIPMEGFLGPLREHYRGFEQVDSLFEFERGLEAERSGYIDMVAGLIPDPGHRLFFRGAYDFDNVIHAWKAAKLGREPVLNGFGSLDSQTVKEAVDAGDWGTLPEFLRTLPEKLEGAHSEGGLALAEYTGESMKWRFTLESAPDEESHKIVRCRIDLMNVKTLIRFKRYSVRKQMPAAVWLGNGLIEPGRFISLAGEPEDELYSFLKTSDYRGLLSLGLGRDIPGWRIDPVLSNYLLDVSAESRYRFFDLSPVIHYLLLRERDEQILRMIIVGKLNRLSQELILEGIRAHLPS